MILHCENRNTPGDFGRRTSIRVSFNIRVQLKRSCGGRRQTLPLHSAVTRSSSSCITRSFAFRKRIVASKAERNDKEPATSAEMSPLHSSDSEGQAFFDSFHHSSILSPFSFLVSTFCAFFLPGSFLSIGGYSKEMAMWSPCQKIQDAYFEP